MIVRRHINLIKSIPYVKVELTLALFISVLVYLVHDVAGVKFFALPNVLPAILGAALAIFLGFRSNASYVRWGDAAASWASILNQSRIFARLIVTFVEAHNHTPTFDRDVAELFKKEVVHRHIAWVHALRLQLREQRDDKLLQSFLLDADWQKIKDKLNKPYSLSVLQGHRIYDGMRSGTLQGFDSFQLEGCMAQFSALQANCERIKTIPIPVQYSFFTRFFVWFFIVVIPFSLIDTFNEASRGWVVIPVTLLMAYTYGIVERAGAVNERPFENKITDVPLTAMCCEIERDLKDMLGEDHPPQIEAVNGYLF